MLFVEDVVVAIRNKLVLAFDEDPFDGRLNTWSQSFIKNIAGHCDAGHTLSSNQARLTQTILNGIGDHLIAYGIGSRDDVLCLLDNPQYRHAPYESAPRVPREVRYLGDNLLGFRCKADETLITRFKELGKPVPSSQSRVAAYQFVRSRSRFDWEQKIWLIPVFRENLDAVRRLIHAHRFHADRAVLDYLALCRASTDQPSTATYVNTERDILIFNVRDNDLLAGWIIAAAGGVTL